jgi:hypothetical protein
MPATTPTQRLRKPKRLYSRRKPLQVPLHLALRTTIPPQSLGRAQLLVLHLARPLQQLPHLVSPLSAHQRAYLHLGSRRASAPPHLARAPSRRLGRLSDNRCSAKVLRHRRRRRLAPQPSELPAMQHRRRSGTPLHRRGHPCSVNQRLRAHRPSDRRRSGRHRHLASRLSDSRYNNNRCSAKASNRPLHSASQLSDKPQRPSLRLSGSLHNRPSASRRRPHLWPHPVHRLSDRAHLHLVRPLSDRPLQLRLRHLVSQQTHHRH